MRRKHTVILSIGSLLLLVSIAGYVSYAAHKAGHSISEHYFPEESTEVASETTDADSMKARRCKTDDQCVLFESKCGWVAINHTNVNEAADRQKRIAVDCSETTDRKKPAAAYCNAGICDITTNKR